MNTQFKSPSELWNFSIEVANLLSESGFIAQAKTLESATKLVCTTGGEWLSELGACVRSLKKTGSFPVVISQKLNIILEATRSEQPYG